VVAVSRGETTIPYKGARDFSDRNFHKSNGKVSMQEAMAYDKSTKSDAGSASTSATDSTSSSTSSTASTSAGSQSSEMQVMLNDAIDAGIQRDRTGR
jgi:type IV secretory pathway TrbL component